MIGMMHSIVDIAKLNSRSAQMPKPLMKSSFQTVRSLLLAGATLFVSAFGGPLQAAETLRVGKAIAPGVAFTNINDAIKAAATGDTIQIHAGTYDEAVVVSKSLTIAGDGPQFVLIRPQVGYGIEIKDKLSVTIRGLSVSSKTFSGILVGNQGIEGGTFDTSISHCVIFGSMHYGIVHSSESAAQAGMGARLFIDHCTIVRNGYQGIYFYNANASGQLTVRNCIFASNAIVATDRNIYAFINSYHSQNNLIFGKQSSDFPTLGNVNPRFVDEERSNFMLESDSLAVDKATIGELDPDGTRADLGAYGGPGSAPFWPYPAGGPVIKDISVSQGAVVQGGKLTIRATATTR